jgi:hypothetical protein
MPTLLHPAPWMPRLPARRNRRSGFVPPETSAEPSPYTRSALPLALAWFVVPAIVLVASFVTR